MLAGKTHGVAGVVDPLLDGPALGVLANRTGADEGRDLDRDADALRDLDHRLDIALERARGAERLDAQSLVPDFLGQPFHVGFGARPRCRKAEVDRSDSELVSQVQEAQLVLDIGVADGWALDAVAERLIVNGDRVRRLGRGIDRVPVGDSVGLVTAWRFSAT